MNKYSKTITDYKTLAEQELNKYNKRYFVYTSIKKDDVKQTPVVCVEIDMGDWKHDHNACKQILKGIGLNHYDSDIMVQDGDAFTAIHWFEVEDRESLSLELKSNPFKIGCYIDRDKVRNMCIAQNWYTRGDVVDYERMLEFCSKTKDMEESLDDVAFTIAKDIYHHSDMREQTEYSKEEYIQNVMHYILMDTVIWLNN